LTAGRGTDFARRVARGAASRLWLERWAPVYLSDPWLAVGDAARAVELALAGGGVDIPLAAFGLEIGEAFVYQYNLFIPWEIGDYDKARGATRVAEEVIFLGAQSHDDDCRPVSLGEAEPCLLGSHPRS
jgi:hypothetical protein